MLIGKGFEAVTCEFAFVWSFRSSRQSPEPLRPSAASPRFNCSRRASRSLSHVLLRFWITVLCRSVSFCRLHALSAAEG